MMFGMNIDRRQENASAREAEEMQKAMNYKAELFLNGFQKATLAAQTLLKTDPFVLYTVCPDGNKPIHKAVAQKNPVIVEWLLAGDTLNGATNLKNTKLETPLNMLVNDSPNVRSNRGGFSSPRLQAQLIHLVGEKCTLQELEENLAIAQGIAENHYPIMKNLIKISTIDPLNELIEKKNSVKASQRVVKNNKRKQNPTYVQQGNFKKHRGTTYELIPIDNTSSSDHMAEVSDNNILPHGIKRLRKSVDIVSL